MKNGAKKRPGRAKTSGKRCRTAQKNRQPENPALLRFIRRGNQGFLEVPVSFL
jgi:hypothetical protein